MFIVETSRSKTLANVAAILIGLLVGFPYLLFTVHLYGKPSPPIPPGLRIFGFPRPRNRDRI